MFVCLIIYLFWNIVMPYVLWSWMQYSICIPQHIPTYLFRPFLCHCKCYCTQKWICTQHLSMYKVICIDYFWIFVGGTQAREEAFFTGLMFKRTLWSQIKSKLNVGVCTLVLWFSLSGVCAYIFFHLSFMKTTWVIFVLLLINVIFKWHFCQERPFIY